jgi:NAD(P)-dependent dehydrogenase (short-subunit alcohol dehydrogenase family)
MAGRLEGKVALITGAARGQGEAHARLFAGEGARVVLCDVLDGQGEVVAKDLDADGRVATYVHLDVTEPADWEAAIGVAEARYGRLDVLVNNAGIVSEADAVEETLEGWYRVVGVNQTGVFLGLKYAVPAMRRAGGGAIVNIASTLGMVGSPDYIAYHASKGAVITMTKSAAITYVGDGIRVNCVCPGMVWSPMTEVLPPHVNDEEIHATPMKRGAEPVEVSHAVLFLASDEASFVTGAVLAVDGGYLAG